MNSNLIPKFNIGDIVHVVGQYANDWADASELQVIGICRKIINHEVSDILDYTIWEKGVGGAVDGWSEQELELVCDKYDNIKEQ